MNYRHTYHAGNHTEVFKHAALVALIELLHRKDRPLFFLDTHAGTGLHDLRSERATRTLEAEQGIAKVAGNTAPALSSYLRIVREVGGHHLTAYPGSPEIVRRLLRADDRLVACELHPEDARELRTNFLHDRRVAVHHRDGYAAIRAFVPPPERRGIVFVDPPFERTDEVEVLSRSLLEGRSKWPTGVFVAWFPIKGAGIMDRLCGALLQAGMRKLLLSVFLPFRDAGKSLAGSGVLVCNPPWQFDERVRSICLALGRSFEGSRSCVAWMADEKGPIDGSYRGATDPLMLARPRQA